SPRSSDLTPPHFYLWGFLKDVVFRQSPITRQDMMDRIRNIWRAIPTNVLLKLTESFEKRVRVCRAVDGGVFKHL
ncbi:hypothetical protein EAI_07081, partial [Harpegnathos saltator]